jgi:hypothetical protein
VNVNAKGVAIFSGNDQIELESQINTWLDDFSQELYIEDIKFSTCLRDLDVIFNVIVLYEILNNNEEDELW